MPAALRRGPADSQYSRGRIGCRAALEAYTKQGSRIFSPTNKFERDAKLLATGCQFENKTLYEVVSETPGRTKMTINDSPIGVMITAGDQMGIPWYFVKDAPTNAQTTGKAPLIDASVAASIAQLLTLGQADAAKVDWKKVLKLS